MSFAKPLLVLLALSATAAFAAESPQAIQQNGSSRWATFDSAGGQHFALSLQADPRADYPPAKRHEVVVLFDTSATQTGAVRIEALEVLDELAQSLTSSASVSLLACDVDTVALTDQLVVSGSADWETARARLQKRIPLGTTDLGKALRTAAAQFSATDAQRTIIYIGDGVNRTNFLTSDGQRKLLSTLTDAKVTVSSLAIGPFVDIATLAALANHTGGILLSRNEIEESTQAIGRVLGRSTAMPVVWIEEASLPSSLASYLPQTFPPLRIDRDTVIVGKSEVVSAPGLVKLSGTCGGQPVEMAWNVSPEESNPDMGFLTAVVEQGNKDGGLSLPTLGSAGLRSMSFALADTATSMVKSGRFALKSGQVDAAIRIAREALNNDPNNAEAISLLNAARKLAGNEYGDIPAGKFMQTGGSNDFSALDETLNAGDLLAEEEAMRRASAAALDTYIKQSLADASRQADEDPTAVVNSLKLLLEDLDNVVDIDAAQKARLRERVLSHVKITAGKAARYRERIQRNEMIRSQADQAQRLIAETNRREEGLKQLVEQFNFLMSEQEYLAASKDVAPEIGDKAPFSVLHNVTREESSLASNQLLLLEAFERREQGFVDAMRGVEEAAVPFDGVPPLIYPPADVWKALSVKRKERYGSINLAGGNDAEQKIYNALKQEIEVDYPGTPLSQVIQDLEDRQSIPIWINNEEIAAMGVDPDTAVVLQLSAPITMRSALRKMLGPLDLTYIVRDEVLEITSTDDAENDPINKVYPVGDLVVPPMPGGGGMMGGMMGGMGGMGGGMGGMGGGMGGMGGGMMGGMGGMGGGMGGMGGGMGGMFAVPDDTSKSSRTSPLALHRAGSSSSSTDWASQFAEASDEERELLSKKVRKLIQRKLQMVDAHLEAEDNAAAVAEFEQIIDITGGLLSAGYPQPWMYQALSLSMEACDYPAAEIKRVLLSGLDFDGSAHHSIKIARYLASKGMKPEALDILKDVAIAEPNRYDVYAAALPLASELKDVEHLRWCCVGILSKAWPQEQAHLYQKAQLLAEVTRLRLLQSNRVIDADVFEQEIKAASVRDIAVRVNWSGDADLDIRVKEPAGTICSIGNPQTISGGVLLGDVSSTNEEASLDGYSEYYVCSDGYAGQYDILVRKVWGEVTGGKATVEIFTDYGTPDQSVIVKQVEVSEKPVVVQVAVKNGHREQPIADAQLANIRNDQLDTARSVLGQFAGSDAGNSSANDYYNFRRALAAGGPRGFGFPVGGGAVGYMPVITTLPEGANLSVTGVVSADRRYVRISPSPFFNGIGEVLTFNFVSGQGGNQGGAGGGIGGGAGGGIGGGIGGGAGGGIGGGIGGGGQGGFGF